MAMKALGNQMSRVVRVNRQKLIETLTANRDKHVKEFNEAMNGYKDTAVKKVNEAFQNLGDRLEKRKNELLKDLNEFTPETSDKFSDVLTILQSVTVNMKVPVSYKEAYDAAIDMATFDTRDELELSGAEFQCFCRDVWDWSYEFSNSTALYKSPGTFK